MSLKNKRRAFMPILNGIPTDIIMGETITDSKTLDERIKMVKKMSESEIQEEVMDLLKEKDLLIAAVEYLKTRLSKAQKPN